MTVQELITSLRRDMKMLSTDASRDEEFVDYVNRLTRGAIRPILVAFKSDVGQREWTMVSTVDRQRSYTLPSDFHVMSELYYVLPILTGTVAAADGDLLTFTLDSSASTSDDAYNGYMIRFTSGTGAFQQRMVSDYVGATLKVTVDEALLLDPSTDTTYAIFELYDDTCLLQQMRAKEVHMNYASYGEPSVYALTDGRVVLGDVPDNAYVLDGWYWRREPDLRIDATITANATTNVLTASDHKRSTGQPVQFTTTGTLPAGLTELTTYYVIWASSSTFKVSTSFEGAVQGVAVDITDTGSGIHTVTDVLPYAGYFDDALRQYAAMLALNRDEYSVKVEMSIFAQIQSDGFEILNARKSWQNGGQAPLRGTRGR